MLHFRRIQATFQRIAELQMLRYAVLVARLVGRRVHHAQGVLCSLAFQRFRAKAHLAIMVSQALENALLAAGVVKPIVKDEEDDSEYLEHRNKLIRAGFRNRVELDSDDESSDFDD